MTDRPTRVASHPDDLNASFEDRLLLALGIWPHHAEQAGYASVLDAVVQIRTDAHKFPMVAEDYGEKADRVEDLEAILLDLIDPDDCTFDHHGYCQAHGWLQEGVCPHRRAKDALAVECGACGGIGDCGRCDGDGCGAPDTSNGYCTGGKCPECGGTGLGQPVARTGSE